MIFGVVLVPAFDKFFDKLDSRIVFATVLLFFRTDIDIFQNIIRRTQRNVYHMSTTRLYRYSFFAISERRRTYLRKIGIRSTYRIPAVIVGHYTRRRSSQKHRYKRKRRFGNRIGYNTRNGCRLCPDFGSLTKKRE